MEWLTLWLSALMDSQSGRLDRGTPANLAMETPLSTLHQRLGHTYVFRSNSMYMYSIQLCACLFLTNCYAYIVQYVLYFLYGLGTYFTCFVAYMYYVHIEGSVLGTCTV